MVKEILEEPQWAVITGGNSPFGKAASVALARAGYNILVSCRSQVVCGNTINILKQILGSRVHIEALELDLTDFSSIRRFAERVKSKRLLISLLVHNAGVYAPAEGSATREGVDLPFAVNYLGPFLLTQLLVPELQRARPARIITVTDPNYADAQKVDIDYVNTMGKKLDLRGQLRVTIHFARNLEHEGKEPNVYVRVNHEGHDEHTTEVINKNSNPTFNQLMVFKTETMADKVHFEVWHKGKTEDTMLADCELKLYELKADTEGLVYSLEKSLPLLSNMAHEDVEGNMGATKEETLRAKLLAHDKYTLQEDFNLLYITKAKHADDQPKNSRTPGSAGYEFKAKDFRDRVARHNNVELSEKNNTVSFVVRKRLNLFKTSERRIVIDINNRMLRNETKHGRTRKAFPFQQVLGVLRNFDHDKVDSDRRLALTFSKTETVDAQGNLLAAGGQRDYILEFADGHQASLFVEVLSPFLISTARFEDGMITFMVQKKLNHFTVALRRLVVDVHQRRLINLDQRSTHHVDSTADQEKVNESTKKVFDFAQIHRFHNEPANPNKVTMEFKGGQRKYEVEFLLEEHKRQFLRILQLFVASNRLPALHVSLTFIKPPQTSSYRYAHHVPMAAQVPAPNAFDDTKPWMKTSAISIPMQPEWHAADWDKSKIMVDRRKEVGQRQPTFTSLQSTLQGRLLAVTMAVDLARRFKRLNMGVTSHVLDPGRMATSMYTKALGLGRRRSYEAWKARMWGSKPSEVAGSLVQMATGKLFEAESGLFAQHRNGRLVVVNVGEDGHKVESAPHPIAECRDESKARQLYDISCMVAMVDFQNPIYSAFLQQ